MAAEQWEWPGWGTSLVSGLRRRLKCQTGSECRADHKLHGGSDKKKRHRDDTCKCTLQRKGCISSVHSIKKKKEEGVVYLSAGRSQQNINDEIIDGGKVVKRTWREKPTTGFSVTVGVWQYYSTALRTNSVSVLLYEFLHSCWQRNCRQVTSSDRASRAMMASLIETHCCLTHIPACNAVGVVSPSLLELQLLPVIKHKALVSLLFL